MRGRQARPDTGGLAALPPVCSMNYIWASCQADVLYLNI